MPGAQVNYPTRGTAAVDLTSASTLDFTIASTNAAATQTITPVSFVARITYP